jgi:hypothetical protein
MLLTWPRVAPTFAHHPLPFLGTAYSCCIIVEHRQACVQQSHETPAAQALVHCWSWSLADCGCNCMDIKVAPTFYYLSPITSTCVAVLSTVHTCHIPTCRALTLVCNSRAIQQLHWRRYFDGRCLLIVVNINLRIHLYRQCCIHGQTLLLHLHIHLLSGSLALSIADATHGARSSECW